MIRTRGEKKKRNDVFSVILVSYFIHSYTHLWEENDR